MRIMAIDLFAIYKGMLYSAPSKPFLMKNTFLDVHPLIPKRESHLVN